MKYSGLALAALGLSVAACSDDAISPSAAGHAPRVSNSIPGQGKGRRSFDDELADLELSIPGFAGLFIDSAGTLTVNVTDRSVNLVGLENLATRFLDAHPSGVMGPPRTRPGLNIRQVKYDFAALSRHAATIRKTLWQLGVNLLDINEAEDILVLGVEDQSLVPPLQSAIRANSIPEDLVRIEVGTLRHTSTQDTRFRTAVAGGGQIGNYTADLQTGQTCSAGITFQLRDWNTFAFTSDYYVLTVDHCSLTRGAVDNYQWYQGSRPLPLGREDFQPRIKAATAPALTRA